MPVAQGTPGTPTTSVGPITVTVAPPRKKRRGETESYLETSGGLPPSASPGSQDDFLRRLGYTEQFAKSLAPPDFIYAMAMIATDDREAAKLGARIAWESQLQFGETFPGRGPSGQIISPLTGQPIDLRQLRGARRQQRGIYGALTAQAILAATRDGVAMPNPTGRRQHLLPGETPTKLTEVTTEQLERAFEALDPVHGKMNAESAVTASIYLAALGTDTDQFKRNLNVINQWNGKTGPFDEDFMVGLADYWTRSNDGLITGTDLVGISNPNLRAIYEEVKPGKKMTPYGEVATTPHQGVSYMGSARASTSLISEYVSAYEVASNSAEDYNRTNALARQVVSDVLQHPPSWGQVAFGGLLEGFDRAGQFIFALAHPIVKWAAGPALAQHGLMDGSQLDEWRETFSESWDMMTYRRRFGDVWANEVGLTEGSTAFSVVSLGSELTLGWFIDPLIIAGQASRGVQLRRLITTSSAREMTHLGAFGAIRELISNPSQIPSRIEELGVTSVRRAWARGVGRNTPDMTFPEWLARQSIVNPDLAARLPKGVGLGAEGVSRNVIAFVRHHLLQEGFDDVTKHLSDELIADTWDIFKVGTGLKSGREVGQRFRGFLLNNATDEATRGINDGVRHVLARRKPRFNKNGLMNKQSQDSIRRALAGRLLDTTQLRPSRINKIVQNALRMSKDEWEAILTSPADEAARLMSEAAERVTGRIPEPELYAATQRMPDHVTWADEVWGLPALEYSQSVLPKLGGMGVALRELQVRGLDSTWARSRVGRMATSFTERSARPVTSIEDYRGAEFFQSWVKAAGVRDPEYLAGIRAKWEEIVRFERPADIETHWRNFVNDVVRSTYEKQYGVPPELVDLLMADVMPRYNTNRAVAQSFYGMQERKMIDTVTGNTSVMVVPVETAPLDTLMLNTMMLPNPDKIKDTIKRAIGNTTGMQDIARRAFPETNIMDLNSEQLQELMSLAREEGMFRNVRIRGGRIRDEGAIFLEHLRSAWIDSVLLRPGWMMKVLPDESFRSFVLLHDIVDRLRAVGHIATPARGAGRLVSRAGRGRGAVSRAGARMQEWSPFQPRVLEVANGEVEFPVGALWADEDAALQGLASEQAFKSMTYRQSRIAKELTRAFETIDVGAAGRKVHSEHWSKILDHRILQSALGKQLLRYMTGSLDDSGQVLTWERLVEWSRNNGRVLALRQGNETLDDVLARARAYVTYIVRAPEGKGAVNTELVRELLERGHVDPTRIRALTRSYKNEELPLLPLVDLEDAVKYRSGFYRRAVGGLYEHLMRKTSGELNRQPTFKALFERELDRRVRLAELRGSLATSGRVPSSVDSLSQMPRPDVSKLPTTASGHVRVFRGGDLKGDSGSWFTTDLDEAYARSLTRPGNKPGQVYFRDVPDAEFASKAYQSPNKQGARWFSTVPVGDPGPLRRLRDVQAEQAARGGLTAGEEVLAQDTFAAQLAALSGLPPPAPTRIGGGLTEADIAAINRRDPNHPLVAGAKDAALRKSLSVMFTYMDHSRFAEAHRFLFPFFAPYQEQFGVWTRLAWTNPVIIGRARQLGRLANEMEFIKRDENGELVVNSTVLAMLVGVATLFHPTALLYTATGAALTKWGTEFVYNKVVGPSLGDMPNIEWLTPVAGINIFLQEPLSVPIGGTNVLVPTPGVGPGLDYLVQYAAEKMPGSWPGKARIMAWAFSYGQARPADFLPSSWMRVFTGAFGWDDDLLERTKQTMLDELAISLPGGLADLGSARDAEAKALAMARAFLVMRGVTQLMSASSPQPIFESRNIRDEYFELINELGPEGAWRAMHQRYPDRPDILMPAIAHSAWTASLPAGGPAGPGIPPTEMATLLLAQPEFAKAAQRHPELAFFLVPSEFREGDKVDYNAYGKQLADGLREFVPATYFEDGELAGGRIYELQRREGWSQYYMALAGFEVKLALANDPEDTSPVYKELWDQYMRGAIEEIGEEYPPWAKDFIYTQTRGEPFLQRNLDMLRSVFSQPLWAETGAGKALAEYFTATQPWRERMYAANLSWDSNGATHIREGLDTLVAELTNRYGEDFRIIHDTWLRNDLHYDTQRRDVGNLRLPERWILNHQVPWEEAWEDARNFTFQDQTSSLEQRRGFLRMRRLSMEAYRIEQRTGYNPQVERWGELNRTQQRQERLETAMKPYVFLSPFERREVLGIKTSEETENLWERVEQRKLEVYEAIDRNPNSADVEWDRYNAFVEGLMRDSTVFAREVKRNQVWGWSLWKTLPKVRPRWYEGQEGEAWRAIKKVTEGVRHVFNGASFVDDEEFARTVSIVTDYIEEWREASPDFDKHYAYLQSISGNSLIDTLIPEFWWIKA